MENTVDEEAIWTLIHAILYSILVGRVTNLTSDTFLDCATFLIITQSFPSAVYEIEAGLASVVEMAFGCSKTFIVNHEYNHAKISPT